MQQPETQYVDSGGVSIAFQVFGSGDVDLVVVPGFVSNLDLQWAEHTQASFNERLASFARVVMYDKAGTGLSDPVRAVPTLEQRMEDLRRVIDAAGVTQPYLMGVSEGGPMSILFAATYPDMIRGLILYGTMACGILDADANPGGSRWIMLCDRLRSVVDNWGRGMLLDVFSPTLAGVPMFRQLSGATERAMASPSMARAALDAVLETDVRDVLPVIEAPTLILHRVGDAMPIEGARYIAENIKNARLAELTGSDHFWFAGDTDPIIGAIEEFTVGTRTSRPTDRMLSTFLYTDIVGSTKMVAEIGDDRWSRTLEQHNDLSREQVQRFRGHYVHSTGDGFLAVFDGPARAVRCASAVIQAVQSLGLSVRSGVHTGECEVLADGNFGGLALHIGARVMSKAGANEIVASSTVRDLVSGSGISFVDIGEYDLKGVPNPVRLFRVAGVPRDEGGLREPAGSDQVAVPDEPAPVRQRVMVAFARKSPGLSRGMTELLLHSRSKKR